MTMHLVHPSLSTTGKRKGKKKFASADAARKARENEESWAALKKKWGVEEEEKKRTRALKAAPLSKSYSLAVPEGRSNAHIKSLDSGIGIATKKDSPQYTGTLIKGIATMHKSNAVPILNDEDAIAISHMRR